MGPPDANGRISLDAFTQRLLIVLTGLLAVIAVELWALRPGPPRAEAQIPDTALQRKHIVDESRRTNELLEQILDHLRRGTIKVSLEQADKPLTDALPVKGGAEEKKPRPAGP